MKNFQGIIFIWIRTNRELFKSSLVYPLIKYCVILTLFLFCLVFVNQIYFDSAWFCILMNIFKNNFYFSQIRYYLSNQLQNKTIAVIIKNTVIIINRLTPIKANNNTETDRELRNLKSKPQGLRTMKAVFSNSN